MRSHVNQIHVGIVMGSRSEWSTIQHIANILKKLGITYDAHIKSPSRNANQIHEYAAKANERGVEIIIAGTGPSTDLPRILASKATMPVLGIPAQASAIKSLKSKLDDSGNPDGNPVGKLVTGITFAENAALLAASILSENHPKIREALTKYRRQKQSEKSSQPNLRNVA